MKKCVICGHGFEGYGNDPRPVKYHGQCCDACNNSAVIPARIFLMRMAEETQPEKPHAERTGAL